MRALLLQLAALAEADTPIHEIEINPFIVGDVGAGAAAVDALVVMGRP